MELHLASMENITCFAFRKLILGATDSYTGILSLNNLIRRNNTWNEIDTFHIENQRQWIQVSTSKEKECEEFIKKLNEHLKINPQKDNIYGIQLNASCPSKQLIQLGQGPALIKRPTKVCNLLKELLKQRKFKVGIKVRLGLNQQEVEEKRIIKLFSELEKINDENFVNVTVHFKHAKQSSSEKYDYSLLNELVKFKLPLVINGGINSLEDFNKIVKNISEKENIRGFMMARQSLKDPDCFLASSNILNKTNLVLRTKDQIKENFKDYCNEKMPKPLYLETIKKSCPWVN